MKRILEDIFKAVEILDEHVSTNDGLIGNNKNTGEQLSKIVSGLKEKLPAIEEQVSSLFSENVDLRARLTALEQKNS
jgi:hypothetical protein